MTGSEVVTEAKAIINEVSKFIVAEREFLEKVVSALLAGGHVLLEDVPGTGKTLTAKLLAKALGVSFKRIQFTPDLLPSDILGTKVWRPGKGEFEFVLGPIFCNLVLADEINRAPPKTQSALLEAMEEGQVTIEGETFKLPQPFFVIATQNPIEFEGVFPLPEAQLDRFMMKLSLGYAKDEKVILRRRLEWKTDDPSMYVQTVTSGENLLKIREYIEKNVKVSDEVIEYISRFTEIRRDSRLLAGPSPRGLVSLLRVSRAMAVLDGRDYVIPDDVKKVAVDVLGHRLVVKPEYQIDGVRGEDIVRDYLRKIPVPK
ncbi:MoxR family ATPase [Thermofilum sp.]|jgi:MoxR-like ATPase|uniref:AAA family ATPase n=1 Tax=Thermofilum sp. TaxID=1961369 RepID=UPI00258AF24F|nr:MoxR family ATPase [Thermofilum sp.]